ncbi:MAG: SNF2-related protein [Bacteroidota bacterium]
MAIGQAIHILDNQGSVLIADPTGSGKTKLLACLELALVSRRWQQGKGDQTYSKIICPPIVRDNWVREFENIHFERSEPISSGILSFSRSSKYEKIISELRRTNILIIDEAHNYLNPKSSRSISLKSSLADCSILATATPINKKAEDLLRLIELLDIDNLGDHELFEYKKLRKQKGLVTSEQTKTLKAYIRKFTVRRTKKQLNKLIDLNKEEYLNREGKKCRYPKHNPNTYKTGETYEDIKIAREIDSLTQKLKGLINLRKIMLRYEDYQDEQRELEKRLVIAKALARYQIHSKLRSSRAALVEHLVGSTKAFVEFDIPDFNKKKETGNIIGTLQGLIEIGRTPKSNFN